MLLNISTYPNSVLRKKSRDIKKVDDKIGKLIDDMIETMHAAPGVGLAAPQIGENINLITVDIGQGAFPVINPKIKKRGKDFQVFNEGCLCLPGLIGPVERSSSVVVEGRDRFGQKIIIEAEGFLATVLQHEIDHLHGVMFIDRVEDKNQLKMVSKREEEENKELL